MAMALGTSPIIVPSRRTMFVSTHDDLEQGLTGPLRQLLLPMASTISRSGVLKEPFQDFLCPCKRCLNERTMTISDFVAIPVVASHNADLYPGVMYLEQ